MLKHLRRLVSRETLTPPIPTPHAEGLGGRRYHHALAEADDVAANRMWATWEYNKSPKWSRQNILIGRKWGILLWRCMWDRS